MSLQERNNTAILQTITQFQEQLKLYSEIVSQLQNTINYLIQRVSELQTTVNIIRTERGTGPSVK